MVPFRTKKRCAFTVIRLCNRPIASCKRLSAIKLGSQKDRRQAAIRTAGWEIHAGDELACNARAESILRKVISVPEGSETSISSCPDRGALSRSARYWQGWSQCARGDLSMRSWWVLRASSERRDGLCREQRHQWLAVGVEWRISKDTFESAKNMR